MTRREGSCRRSGGAVRVLLAGANNVGNIPASDAKMSDITKGIKALLDTIRDKAPKATIILMGILPRNDGPEPMAPMPSINKITPRHQPAIRAPARKGLPPNLRRHDRMRVCYGCL